MISYKKLKVCSSNTLFSSLERSIMDFLDAWGLKYLEINDKVLNN